MSEQTPGGWPDASKPGVPLEPERDGWHFLQHPEDLRPVPTPWDAAHAAWCSGGMHSPQGVIELGYHYVGPCLTPTEVAAREAAARREGVEMAANVAEVFRALCNQAQALREGACDKVGAKEASAEALVASEIAVTIRTLAEDGR